MKLAAAWQLGMVSVFPISGVNETLKTLKS